MRNGLYQKWYENGNKEYEGNYQNAVKEGPVKKYYNNSQLNYTGSYSEGRKTGVFLIWDEKGNLSPKKNYY